MLGTYKSRILETIEAPTASGCPRRSQQTSTRPNSPYYGPANGPYQVTPSRFLGYLEDWKRTLSTINSGLFSLVWLMVEPFFFWYKDIDIGVEIEIDINL